MHCYMCWRQCTAGLICFWMFMDTHVACIAGCNIWADSTASNSILPWSTSYSQCVLTIAAASLWGVMCNTYGICECRSPTDHADTSQRMCHNYSCGMRAVEKLTWYCTRIGSTPNEVSQGPSLQLDLPLLAECTSVSKHLFMPIACVTTRLW